MADITRVIAREDHKLWLFRKRDDGREEVTKDLGDSVMQFLSAFKWGSSVRVTGLVYGDYLQVSRYFMDRGYDVEIAEVIDVQATPPIEKPRGRYEVVIRNKEKTKHKLQIEIDRGGK